MPIISFLEEKKIESIEVSDEVNLMQALLAAQRPVASSCLGKAICSKCRIQIIHGAENLSPESELERGLRERNRISSDYRISCQTLVCGDVCIDASYW